MRYALAILVFLTFGPPTLRGADASPTTSTTRAAPAEQLFFGDALKFPIPDGWQVNWISQDTKTIKLVSDDEKGVILVNTTPQTASLTQNPETRDAIAKKMLELRRQQMEANKVDMIDPPHLKHDDGFFIRMEDRYRQGEQVADRVHVYRVMGFNLLMVASISVSDSADEVAKVHKIGDKLLYQIEPSKIPPRAGIPTGKAMLFRKAQVKLTPAKGWVSEKEDAAQGVIARFYERIGPGVIQVRVEAAGLPGKPQEQWAQRVASEDLKTMAVPDAKAAAAEPVSGGRFRSKSQQKYDQLGLTWRVENRVVVIGDRLLSITNRSTEFKAGPISQYADDLANSAEVFAPR
jgi:hypothetical protein